METISKRSVRILSGLLAEYGVRHIVVSSGSRCAPLSVAFSRSGLFSVHPVIDERSAAFVALGMALTLGGPVAMVCTSGSAPLNFAPALAEAFYRRVPLIAITADRPWWWVGQREGQTIRQAHALDAVVRCSVDLPPGETDADLSAVNRMVNMALSEATSDIQGPVHINVQLDTPLTAMAPAEGLPCWRKISRVAARPSLPPGLRLPVGGDADVLVVVGDNRFDAAALDALRSLSRHPGVLVLAEVQANVPWALRPACFGNAFADASFPRPGLLVSLGGALVDNNLKQWLRAVAVPHLSIGPDDGPVDTFGSLVMQVDLPAAQAIRWLADCLSDTGDSYAARCLPLCRKSVASPCMQELAARFTDGIVHVSNGSAIRLAQHVDWASSVRLECNRGVSGIEGSTSTAVGAAMVAAVPVLLISGDMSAAYDIAALALPHVPASFRMVVLDNAGGDIFRHIPTTRALPELDSLFVMAPKLPLRQLAAAYGFAYYEYEPGLGPFPGAFLQPDPAPAILRVIMQVNK